MALRSGLDSKQVIPDGKHSVLDFQGVQGATVYYHRASSCVIEGSSVTLTLNPDCDRNPMLSVKNTYNIILSDVRFEARADGQGYRAQLSSVEVKGAAIPVGIGWLAVNKSVDAKISQVEIERGAIDAHLEPAHNGDQRLSVTVNPEHLNKGIVANLLNSLGLLKPCKLSGTIRPETPVKGQGLNGIK